MWSRLRVKDGKFPTVYCIVDAEKIYIKKIRACLNFNGIKS